MIVLITGVSGGLGQVLAKTLSGKGLTVYGTARNPGKPEPDNCQPGDWSVLAMEITNSESVRQCIEQVIEREGRIDAVINCVNSMFIGSTEEQSVEEVQALYNTNVFGALRVCKAVLPVMRQQGAGIIINMSSLGGLLAVPHMGAYTSAKFALETLSEALYHEVRDQGIDVVIMQPVAMNMNRNAGSQHLHLVEKVAADSFSRRMMAGMERDTAASKLTPEMVSEKIHQVILSKRRPLRVPMDKAVPLSILKRLAPQSLINRLISGLVADINKLSGKTG